MDLLSSLQALIDDEIDIKEGLNIKLNKQDSEMSDLKGIYLKNLEEEKNRVLFL